jgi:hypothetical protein
MFEVVNVVLVQMNRNHVHVSLLKVQNVILQVEILSKNEIYFLAKSCVLQRQKFFLVSFLDSES